MVKPREQAKIISFSLPMLASSVCKSVEASMDENKQAEENYGDLVSQR